ncbi:MAG: response regulator [Marinilabiliales bacterium]|nr:MAG: response regulator [Marinilabiliales bacterium]
MGNIYDFSNKVILIVEDIDTSSRFYKAALKSTNAKLILVENGQTAIDVFESSNKIDLVFLDLNLPDFDGFEVLKHIRKTNKEIPIVVQTAYMLSGEEETSYELGANDFITKPITIDVLQKTIDKNIA